MASVILLKSLNALIHRVAPVSGELARLLPLTMLNYSEVRDLRNIQYYSNSGNIDCIRSSCNVKNVKVFMGSEKTQSSKCIISNIN